MTKTHPFLSRFRSYHFHCMTNTGRHLMEEREVQGAPTNSFHALNSSLTGGLHWRSHGSLKDSVRPTPFSLTNGFKPQFQNSAIETNLPPTSSCYICALAVISLIQLPKANNRNHTGCDTEDENNHSTIKAYCRNQHLHW